MPENDIGNISREWVVETRKFFLEFLRLTQFPEPLPGKQGFTPDYPEWLIMLIGVIAVKCREKSYLGIHRLSDRYWKELCGPQVSLPPISKAQLRARLKKIRFRPGTGAGYIHQIFPKDYLR